MKKYFFTLVTFMFVLFAAAQKGPLNGSGKIILKQFGYNDFDKLHLNDLAGKVEVTIGALYTVDIAIDDNLQSLLQVTNDNHTLSISLKGNHQNRLYIENTNIVIKISMPLITAVKQNGNNNLQVDHIAGTFLKVKCTGNGNVHLSGTLDDLTIVCAGNGNVNAAQLAAKNVQVIKRGNGNVTLHTDYIFTARGSGNGSVINTGKGIASSNSGISGNGSVQYPQQKQGAGQSMPANEKTKLVSVIIKNITSSPASLIVKYPVSGSYGLDVPAQDTITPSFPAGTKIYYQGRVRVFAKPLFIITATDEKQTFIIK